MKNIWQRNEKMKRTVKFILSILIFAAITTAGYWVGKFFSIVFEGSTIRIWFIPLGHGTAGTIMWVLATFLGFVIACIVANDFLKNRNITIVRYKIFNFRWQSCRNF